MTPRRADQEIEPLVLEHPDLDPFETSVRHFAELAMGAVGRLAQSKNLTPKELFASSDPTTTQEVRRVCHVAFGQAQQAIGASLIALEMKVRGLEALVKSYRRDRRTVTREVAQIYVLNQRIQVLRRLVDAIAHQIVGMKPWIARRFAIDRKARRLDPEQLQLLLDFAAARNAEHIDRFALVADMTTFVHVCDLVEVFFAPTGNEVRLIELKEGQINEEILWGDDDKAPLPQGQDKKFDQQVARIEKQQARLSNVKRILDTDEGTDALTGKALRMSRQEVILTGYATQLGDLVKRSLASGGAKLTIDSVLRLVGFRNTTLGEASVADILHEFHHMGGRHMPCLLGEGDPVQEIEALSVAPKAIDMVVFATQAMWALPIFLWEIEPELIFDLLAGRVRVFAQIHGEDFRGLLKAIAGFDSKWLSKGESSRYRAERLSGQIPGAPKGVSGLCVTQSHEHIYFSGFFWRMVGDLARPADLVAIVALDQDPGLADRARDGAT